MWLFVTTTLFAQEGVEPEAQDPSRARIFDSRDWLVGSISNDGKWVAATAPQSAGAGVSLIDVDHSTRKLVAIPGVDQVKWYHWTRTTNRLLIAASLRGQPTLLLLDPLTEAFSPLMLPGDVADQENATYINGYAFTIERIARGSDRQVLELDQDASWRPVDDPENSIPQRIAKSVHVKIRNGMRGSDLIWTARKIADADATIVASPEDTRQGSQLVAVSNDGMAWFLSSVGSDVLGLTRLDPARGQQSREAAPPADIRRVLIDPLSGAPDAYLVERAQPQWIALDGPTSATLARIEALGHGFPDVLDRSSDDRYWLISFANDGRSPWGAIYDRRQDVLRRIALTDPADDVLEAGDTHAFSATGRDGHPIDGYVTLPTSRPCPESGCAAVVVIHGGPAMRDFQGYRRDRAWLSTRGYAVITVNYRGSRGFGKQFEHSDAGRWGSGINDEIDDFVEAAVGKFRLDARHVAVMGSSFGGYSALVALGRSDRYACGIVDSAFADLRAFIDDGVRRFGAASDLPSRAGDPSTPAGARDIERRSPMSMLATLRAKPLLQFHGGLDQVVSMGVNKEFVAAMRNQKHYSLFFFANDGHGLLAPDSQTTMHATSEAFLASCLDGRAGAPDAEEQKAIDLAERVGQAVPSGRREHAHDVGQ